MRILILGGTGFISARVVHALDGHDVTIFHRGTTCSGLLQVRHVHGRRDELAAFRTTIERLQPDVVLDMLARNGTEAETVTRSVGHATGRFVMVSSISVYRAFGVLMGTEAGAVDDEPASESAPLRRQWFPYRGREPRRADDPNRWLDDYDKIPAERAYREHATPCSIVRLPMVYGPRDPDSRLAAYLQRMVAGRPAIPIHASAAPWRNARGFVDNVAAAIARVVVAGRPDGIYNVSEPEDLPEAEWIGRIGREMGWTGTVRLVPDDHSAGAGPIHELPRAANFRQHLRMDTSRIRLELEHAEPVSRGDALQATIQSTLPSLQPMDSRADDVLLASL